MLYYRLFLFVILAAVLGLIFLQSQLEANLIWVASRYLAQLSTGISATVPPNPINNWVQQLKEKEVKLSEKEKNLAEKETLMEKQILEKISAQQKSDKKAVMFYLVLAGLGIFLLILLNFYLDWRRNKSLGIKNFKF